MSTRITEAPKSGENYTVKQITKKGIKLNSHYDSYYDNKNLNSGYNNFYPFFIRHVHAEQRAATKYIREHLIHIRRNDLDFSIT